MRAPTYTPATSRSRRAAHGFSIIELMVAMALSLLLLAGIVAIFSSSRASYESTDRLSRIQESGRFALDQITRHVRAAGFVGCARQPTYLSTSLNDSATLQWAFQDGPVRGLQATGVGVWSPALDTVVIPNAASGSDVLVLRVPARDAEPMRLTASMATATDDITVENVTTGVRVNDTALAYSCEAQSYFQVTSFAGGVIGHAAAGANPGNAADTLNYAFRTNAEVIPVETVIYYVRASSAAVAAAPDNTLPLDTRSLWRRVGALAPEELVEGVEQMQVEYGVDTNADRLVDEYRTAAAVGNWANVFSVTVALLVRSLEPYGLDRDQRTYQLLNTDVVNVVAPGDARLREVFTATASIRNRVPLD